MDVETCETCGGTMRLIASLEDPAVIKRCLAPLENGRGVAQHPEDPPHAPLQLTLPDLSVRVSYELPRCFATYEDELRFTRSVYSKIWKTNPSFRMATCSSAHSRMKVKSQLLKTTPKIAVDLTSDSIFAGDHCDAPHRKTVEVYSFVDPEAFVKKLLSGYPPAVAGTGHS